MIDRSQGNGFFGHAKHDTTSLVLGDHVSAMLMHFKYAFGSVAAQTGHNDTDYVTSGITRNRLKQHLICFADKSYQFRFAWVKACAQWRFRPILAQDDMKDRTR